MELLFPTILSYILEYKYIGLFIFSVLASAGIPLPLDLSVVAIGALVSQGVFGFTETLLVFILGNVLGDSFDYFAARLVEKKAIHESYLKKYSFFTGIEEYLKRNTGLTIILSRFMGVVSSPTNFLAGYTNIPYKKFLTFDLIGNTLSGITLLVIGILVGDQFTNKAETISFLISSFSVILLLYLLIKIFLWHKKKVASR